MMAAAELAGFEHRRLRRLLLEQIPAGLRPLSPLYAEEARLELVEEPADAGQAPEDPAGPSGPHEPAEEVSSCPG